MTNFKMIFKTNLLIFVFLLMACSQGSVAQPDFNDKPSTPLKYSFKRGVTLVPTKKQRRVALVIGNNAYLKASLKNAGNDADDMATVLTQVGFEVMKLKNVSLEKMETAIREFGRKLSYGGIGLFYFSGHGAQYQGENYLFPIGAMLSVITADHLRYKTVNVSYILTTMESAKNDLNIIFLDACRNNPLAKSLLTGRNIKMTKGLALMPAPNGSLIAYATRPNKLALDGGKGERNSPYVKYLKREILKPGIPILDMLTKVRAAVKEETNEYQAPGFYSELDGSFCFVGTCGTDPPVPPKPSTKVFRDRLQNGSFGPEMVKIPTGQFRMGDIQGTGDVDEQPVHRASIDNFAIGRYEITFAEYDRFAQTTGKIKSNDEGWGRGNRPVINVSWQDAMDYTAWLSQQTDKQYRLPTEEQWEYIARAGTTTQYWWGNTIGNKRANCNGCGSSWDFRKTAPVGSFSANAFNLYDIVGNVWEWTCSKYEAKYNGQEQYCLSSHRGIHVSPHKVVLRGGSWNDKPKVVRVSNRYPIWLTQRKKYIGFRVCRLGTRQ